MNKFTPLQFRFFIFISMFCSCISMGWAQNEEDDQYADCPMKQPYLDVGTEESDVVCNLPGSITFWIKGYDKSSNIGTDYYIYYGDQEYTGSIDINDGTTFRYKDHLTNEQLATTNGLITYTYNKSYCDLGEDFWEIKVMAIGCNPKYMRVGSTSLQLQKKGIVNFEENVECDYKACFTNKSEGFIDLVCEVVEYYMWDFGDGTIKTQFTKPEISKYVCHDYKCAGKYNVKLYAYSGLELENGKRVGSNCGSDSISKEITILPLPELKKIENINVCKGQTVPALNLPNLDVCMYDWYNPTTKKCEKKDICALFKDPAGKPKKVAQRFDYTVKGDYIGLEKGTYTLNADLLDEKKFIPSFTARNETDKSLTATVCITPYNENGCKGEEVCYTITVHPEAKMTNIQNLSFCHNTTTEVPEFKASIPDVTFTWKVKEGDWQKIGMLTNQGEGNIPSFTAINNTKDPIKVTIEVHANSEMCNGSTDEFTITVYPYPTFETKFQSPTTCNGTDGWIEFSQLNINTNKYIVKYIKDEKEVKTTFTANNQAIKLTGLSKGKYTNIAIAASGSECFTPANDIELVDPPLPNAPKISSNSPVCTGTALELKVEEADSDIQNWEWVGPKCNDTEWKSTQKDATRAAMDYCMAGTYKLTVYRNKCEASSSIDVAFREDPEVTLSSLTSVCIGTFTINDEVTYNWKNIPADKQKVKWEIIDSEGNIIDTKNTAKPTFTFNTPGNYKVRVNVEGFGCNGNKLMAEQPLKVKDTNYTLDITSSDTEICINQSVSFTNNTTKTEEIKYNWSISPSTGVEYSNGTSATSEAPQFFFKETGNYSITVTADNGCQQQTKLYAVKVINNPDVQLNLPDVCVGNTFVVSNESALYTWNNVEEEGVTWSATPAEGIEFDNANSLYPTIRYTKIGTYTIRVDMPDKGCGTKNYAEKKITVYDDNTVLDLKQDQDVICAGQKLSFKNNTNTQEPLTYTWSVIPNEEVVISDNHALEPEITFNNPGNYDIKVLVKGVCYNNEHTYKVRVNKDPEVQLSTIESICNNTKLTLDQNYVQYNWNNLPENERNIQWSVTPNTGLVEENTNTTTPSYTFTEIGTYTISVKIDGTGCSKQTVEATVDVTVIADNLDLKIEQDKTQGCVPLDIQFTNNTAEGDEITYTWTVDQNEDWWDYNTGNEHTKSPAFKIIQEGTYNIQVEAKNKCNTKKLDYTISAYDKVNFALDALPTVCSEYTFNAASQTEGLHLTGNQDNITSLLWNIYKLADNGTTYQICDPSVYEYTSGNSTSLYPVIRIKQWGQYKIELKASTHCNDATISTLLTIDEPIAITLPTVDPLCANIPDEVNLHPYALQATPTNGTWSWANNVPTEQQNWLDTNRGLFYPNSPGEYKLTYSVQGPACTAQKELTITVKDYPYINAGNDIHVCEKDETKVLLGGVPEGGIWSGNHVTYQNNAYYFAPPTTVGSYDMTYTIQDEFGCTNTSTIQGHVHSLPVTNFGPETHCLPNVTNFTPDADASTHQFEWDYGDGTQGVESSHLYEKIGSYAVKLTVKTQYGCVNSQTKTLLVEKTPDPTLIVSEHMGCSPFTPEIKLDYEYADNNTIFEWDFGKYGVQNTIQPQPIDFTSLQNDTTFHFSITVKNHCGETTLYDSVRVLASAHANFAPSKKRGCSPLLVSFKNTSMGSVRDMRYTWNFGDNSSVEHGIQATHTFSAAADKDATYTVMLIAENQCGADTAYHDIYVIPSVVYPQIVNPKGTACVGDEVCIQNKTLEVTPHHEIITYKWNFGNGHLSDNPNDTCTVYNTPGKYKITLNITTSCGSSETDSAFVEVFDLPKFSLTAPSYVCDKDTVRPIVTLFSDIRDVTWNFGNGDTSHVVNPAYVYAHTGEYVLKATATENNFAECQASKELPILIRELPAPIIQPLEVDTCSPYVYVPQLSTDDYFSVDYINDGYINATPRYTYINNELEPVIYPTTFYLEDKFGCKSQQHGLITIYPQPIASITIAEVTEARPEVVTFANNSYGANYCKWTLPYRGITETCNDVQEYYYDNTLQTTYLEVGNEYGCTDKDSVDHQPMMKGLYFPNTFAPNGVTEENRTFNGIGIGLKSYKLEIYDLYGNLIFYTESLDENGSPNQGWDGRDFKGNMMPQDVYSWKVEAVFLDGSVYSFGNDHNNIPGTEVNDVNLHRGSVLLLHR